MRVCLVAHDIFYANIMEKEQPSVILLTYYVPYDSRRKRGRDLVKIYSVPSARRKWRIQTFRKMKCTILVLIIILDR